MRDGSAVPELMVAAEHRIISATTPEFEPNIRACDQRHYIRAAPLWPGLLTARQDLLADVA
jgi:hypothetical protein